MKQETNGSMYTVTELRHVLRRLISYLWELWKSELLCYVPISGSSSGIVTTSQGWWSCELEKSITITPDENPAIGS